MVDKVPPCFSSMQRMRRVSRLILLAGAGALSLLTGCETARLAGGKLRRPREHLVAVSRDREQLTRPLQQDQRAHGLLFIV